MYSFGGNTTVINCTFSGNTATNVGGGMANDADSNTTVINCTFSGNTAGPNGGGGMFNFNCSATVTNCILWGNLPNDFVETGGSYACRQVGIKGRGRRGQFRREEPGRRLGGREG